MVDAPKPLDVSVLSSHQRSALLEAMHAQLNLLTTQVNALTQAVNEQKRNAETLAYRFTRTLDPMYDVDKDVYYSQRIRDCEMTIAELVARFVGQRGLMARLRWLLTGR